MTLSADENCNNNNNKQTINEISITVFVPPLYGYIMNVRRIHIQFTFVSTFNLKNERYILAFAT